MSAVAFHAILARTVAKYGTQAAAADALGVSPAYLSDLMQGKREPGPKVLHALGLEKVTTYRKAKE